MDENKSGTPNNSEDFDFDSFFNSIENFETFGAAPKEENEKEDKSAEFAPETNISEVPQTEPEIPAESLDFIDSAKQDIDNMLSDLAEPEPEPVAEPAAPAASEDDDSFQITIPLQDIKTQPLPVENYHSPSNYKPSVTYIPDDTIDINEIPGYEIKTKSTKKADSSKKKKKKKKASKSEIIRRVIFTLSILVILGSGGYLLKSYVLDPYMVKIKNEKAVGDLIDVDSIPQGTNQSEMWAEIKKKYPNVKFKSDMLLKYANLYAANSDLRGWISIPAFGIDMPLAQGADNSYYLKKDIYRKWTEYGVPFFDYRNNIYFLDRNTVIYGHNMKYSDKIFGMLEDYRTVDGFKRAPTIQCNTIYEDYTWKVYAAFITNSEAKDDNGYVFNYTFTRLNDDKFEEYIKEVDRRALYKTGVDMRADDTILTLSTCCYDFDSAKLVIIARLVRDGEGSDVDTSKASANPNPKYPQAWYDSYNKSNPYTNDPKWYATN